MLKYTIAMSVRVVCIALCLVVPGWWIAIPAAGAVFLPYFAVVIANNVRGRSLGTVQRPGAVVRIAPESSRAEAPRADPLGPESGRGDRAEDLP
jgi:hypothetical protein